jgi:general stress protein YciG
MNEITRIRTRAKHPRHRSTSRARLASKIPRRSRANRAHMSFNPDLTTLRRFSVTTGERKERRGFASMSAEKQREIASKGGRAAHEKGTAHEWNADEARNAGRKGGQVSRGGRGRLIVPAETAQPGAVVEGTAENRAE